MPLCSEAFNRKDCTDTSSETYNQSTQPIFFHTRSTSFTWDRFTFRRIRISLEF